MNYNSKSRRADLRLPSAFSAITKQLAAFQVSKRDTTRGQRLAFFFGTAACFAAGRAAVGFATGFAAFGAPATSFPSFLTLAVVPLPAAAAFSPLFAIFLSFSFFFGGSLIPESLRKIFSRSSGVLPRP